MSETTDISRAAGDQFRSASDFSFSDAERQRLRYHLRRLTVVGLTRQDEEDLLELGRLAFLDADVTEHATKIKQRSDASPLAFAIADILDQAGRGNLKAVMLGAVLGAYTSLRGVPEVDQSAVAVLGAIGGAVAMSTGNFISENIDRRSWDDYLRKEE
jgi:hypothetical protein